MAKAAAVSQIHPPPVSLLTGSISAAGALAVTRVAPIAFFPVSRMAGLLSVEGAGAGIGENLSVFETAVVFEGASDLLNASGMPPIPHTVTAVAEGGRSQELRFRETHRELLRSFAGQWVCVDRDTLVAHGPDGAQVVETARRHGVRVPYIFRVPDDPPDVVPIGL